jgi:dihydrolipoamide dehydrogenase
MPIKEVHVPDIGDFEQVDVIEVLVAPGDDVAREASLITLESDKAAMEIPCPYSGRVSEVKIAVGDKVSQGSPILTLAVDEDSAAETGKATPAPEAGTPAQGKAPAEPTPEPKDETAGEAPSAKRARADWHTSVLVIGGGPGGYTAAFRAADLGKSVTLVERYPRLGGVCLNVGCIPSKALLHVAAVIGATETLADHGVRFGKPAIALDALRDWKQGIVKRLSDGLEQLARRRQVTLVQGVARFTGDHTIEIETDGERQRLEFEQAIIAAGSRATRPAGLAIEDPRVMDSTRALQLDEIPGRLLVIGGGIIGLEMACVYDALGARVTVVELTDRLITGCDRDLLRPLRKRIASRYENIYLGTRVSRIEPQTQGLEVYFDGPQAPVSDRFDRVLVAVGRRPNGDRLQADAAGIQVDERGFIPVDAQQRTNLSHIYAIGDIAGDPMLAHKATHQGKIAAEVIAGQPVAFEARAIPSVAYTDPEIAWMGLTETEAQEKGIAIDKAVFPWSASGRVLGLGRDDGFTKLLFDRSTGRLAGASMVGPHAGDLIAETVLALEMGADATDIALSIHPHPTLSETIAFAAEVAAGSVSDLYMPVER